MTDIEVISNINKNIKHNNNILSLLQKGDIEGVVEDIKNDLSLDYDLKLQEMWNNFKIWDVVNRSHFNNISINKAELLIKYYDSLDDKNTFIKKQIRLSEILTENNKNEISKFADELKDLQTEMSKLVQVLKINLLIYDSVDDVMVDIFRKVKDEQIIKLN